ncbi:signal peptide peptidase SppA [bacterium]|nr:signal peptide peptidase SppA [bacterium]
MKQTIFILILLLLTASISLGEGNVDDRNIGTGTFINPYGSRSIIPLPYDARALPLGTSALWSNPAGIGVNGGSGFMFMGPFSDGDAVESSYFGSDFGVGINLDGLGFSWEASRNGIPANRFTWGSSIELDDGLYLGYAYHWSSGLNRQNSWDVGVLSRPTRWLSVGLQITDINSPRSTYLNDTGEMYNHTLNPTYNFGLAVRPFGPMLTLAADATLWNADKDWYGKDIDYGEEIDPTFSMTLAPHDGISLRAGYAMDREYMFVGISHFGGNTELGANYGSRSDATANSPEFAGMGWIRMSSEYHVSPLQMVHKKKHRVVVMKLDTPIVEEPMPYSFFSPQYPTLLSYIRKIDKLRNDESVDGLLLKIGNLSMGGTDRVELRDALVRFKNSGKKIVVYADTYSLGTYYLASVADKILLHTAGDIAMPGIDANRPYLKSMLEKVGIEMQVVHVGKYKSAGETLSRDGMSDAARESLDAVVETIWLVFLSDIAEGRNVDKAQVQEWIDNTTVFEPQEALDMGLVDALVFHDEIKKEVKNVFGEDESIAWVSEKKYNMQEVPDAEWEDMLSPKIAVIYAVGGVNVGNAGRDNTPLFGGKMMGSDTIVKAIKKARSDKRVKAIVLRVDSPGGSALASDIILREIERTVDKDDEDVRHVPVIVSMSDVAASGGYYISCKADKIMAPKTCITGSIGVIGMKPVLAGTYEKIGISHDGVQRGAHADIWSTTRAWSEDEVETMHASMLDVYDRFLVHVSEGRDLDTAKVHEIGQGRIWSGEDALELGLIDEIGGFWDAIEEAKKMAGIKEGELVTATIYPTIGGMDMEADVKEYVRAQLPATLRQTLEAEETLNEIGTGKPILLAPVTTEVIKVD